jgi:hypothetical protein
MLEMKNAVHAETAAWASSGMIRTGRGAANDDDDAACELLLHQDVHGAGFKLEARRIKAGHVQATTAPP